MATLLSLLITITFGKRLINILRRKQVGEEVRDLGLEGQLQKKGTPTMGGIIINCRHGDSDAAYLPGSKIFT